MSEKRMAISLTVLEIGKSELEAFYPLANGIRIKIFFYSCSPGGAVTWSIA